MELKLRYKLLELSSVLEEEIYLVIMQEKKETEMNILSIIRSIGNAI